MPRLKEASEAQVFFVARLPLSHGLFARSPFHICLKPFLQFFKALLSFAQRLWPFLQACVSRWFLLPALKKISPCPERKKSPGMAAKESGNVPPSHCPFKSLQGGKDFNGKWDEGTRDIFMKKVGIVVGEGCRRLLKFANFILIRCSILSQSALYE